MKTIHTHFFLFLLAALTASSTSAQSSDNGDGTFSNPLIYADVPDPDITRVGDTFYMVSTTMHYSPGCTIMKSKDLVNWTVCGYAYDYIAKTDPYSLRNGQNDYASGSWAANIRYDKYEQRYYVITTCNSTGRTYFFTTKDVEKGPWHRSVTDKCYDPGLLFADNGTGIDKYVVHPSDDLNQHQAYLRHITTDNAGNVSIDDARVIIPYAQVENPSEGLRAEGFHGYKLNDYYYIFSIQGQGAMRQEIVWRSKDIENGPWEVKKVFNGHMQDTSGNDFMAYTGVAQGGIVSLADNTDGTTDGTWYSFLFEDYGAVGRIPVLLPMQWDDEGWPVIGNNGTSTPVTMQKPVQGQDTAFPAVSDEFDNQAFHYQLSDTETSGGEFGTNGSNLKIEWQWNHNPNMKLWSLTAREGWLRLTTDTVVSNIQVARNTLTQRTFGPVSAAVTCLDVSGMQDGDVAGISSFQNQYGFVGVEVVNGEKRIVMHRSRQKDDADGFTVASVPCPQNVVYLRVDCDFRDRTDKAYFYYSFDNETWEQLGDALSMAFDWPHFVGQRFALFFFSKQKAGGHADFDWFHIDTQLIQGAQNPVPGINIYQGKKYLFR